jgi:hypothetical protein
VRLVGVSPVMRQRADPEPADPDAADAGTVLIFDRAR